MNDQIPLHFDIVKDALLEGLLSKSFEIDAPDVDAPDIIYSPSLGGVGGDMPLFDEEDHAILMHREAHFASSFETMLQAYKEESPASVLDIDSDRIYELMLLEKKLGKNIAPLILHAQDALVISRIRKMYRLFREVLEEEKNPLFCAIAELILLEDPFDVVEKKCLAVRESIISSLITIIQNDVLYNPLFPGYGMAPIHAAHIIAKLKAKEAIPYLFCMLDQDSFDVQNAALKALSEIGDEAKEFCIKNLESRPLTKNNELAAMALASFDCDDAVAKALLRQLADSTVLQKEPLIFYILSSCEILPEKFRPEFFEILKNTTVAKEVQQEILLLTKMWKKRL